ncbi:hypothetical protein [Salegentibacter sediminis]|uniref:hypothetical protein n=1 Tax=Salegentibacter sediminis TaxID=1930251 RepID=UPI0009BEFAA8|nr:hypothetical protein [Salegentibacter sediminis]
MKMYYKEAQKNRKICDFEYGREYSIDAVAEKLGFVTDTAKTLFYTTLIKHGIINSDLEPSYLSFMAGLIKWPESSKGEIVVSYPGTMMIGDLLEAYDLLPPES